MCWCSWKLLRHGPSSTAGHPNCLHPRLGGGKKAPLRTRLFSKIRTMSSWWYFMVIIPRFIERFSNHQRMKYTPAAIPSYCLPDLSLWISASLPFCLAAFYFPPFFLAVFHPIDCSGYKESPFPGYIYVNFICITALTHTHTHSSLWCYWIILFSSLDEIIKVVILARYISRPQKHRTGQQSGSLVSDLSRHRHLP